MPALPGQPQHIRVFLASPNDVPDERRAARLIVDRINHGLARELGWYIDLYGWEDTLPGLRRPQELINEEVDICDLFIGLLHRRWGTPTGGYSSGFEEEFQRARARHRQKGTPEIWLFFKKLSDELVDDPGEGVRRVLLFKAEQQAAGDILYREVASTAEWQQQLNDCLTTFLGRRFRQAQRDQDETVFHSDSTAARSSRQGRATGSRRDPAAQAAAAFETVASVLRSGNPDAAEAGLSEFEVARTYLGAHSLMADLATQDYLSVHGANLLYRHRETLRLTPSELQLFLRSAVGNLQPTIPTWYWLRQLTVAEQEDALLAMALEADRSTATRALSLLASAKIEPSEKRDFFKRVMSRKPNSIRAAALAYVSAVGTLDDLAGLEDTVADRADLKRSLEERHLEWLARNDPSSAFSQVLKESAAPREVMNRLRDQPVRLSTHEARQGLQHADPEVRSFTIRRLVATRRLRKAEAMEALSDDRHVVRAAAVDAVLRSGWTVPFEDLIEAVVPKKDESVEPDLVDALKVRVHTSFGEDELVKRVQWFSIEGPIAYEALVTLHFDHYASVVRGDLRDHFKRIKDETVRRYERTYGSRTSSIVEEWARYEEMMRILFTTAALRALVLHGSPGDAEFGRAFLGDKSAFVKVAAVDVLSKHGRPEDAELLLKRMGDLSVKGAAVSAALHLSPGMTGAARAVLDSTDFGLVRLALESVAGNPDAVDVLESSTWSESADLRLEAVKGLCRTLDRAGVVDFLTRYVASESYYYNVVVYVDRFLYSKGKLRVHFTA